MKLILILIAILCGSSLLSSQNLNLFLAIDPVHGSNRLRLYEGDLIELKLTDGSRFTGEINRLSDSALFVENDSIPLKTIQKVILRGHREAWGLLADLSLKGGLGFMAVVSFNGLINNDSPVITETQLISSLGAVAGSFLFKEFSHKRIKIKSHSQLKVIDLRMGP